MMKIVNSFIFALSLALAPFSFAAGDADAGKSKSTTCAACHGADGNSPAPTFPKLAGLGEKYLFKQMQDVKAGARKIPEMTGMLDNLSDQDLADIAAYYSAQQRQLSGAKDVKLDLGEKIYRAGNLETGVPACTGCHAPSGNGNAPAGYPAIGGQFSAYIAKQLRAFRTAAHDPGDPTGRANDGDIAVMRGVAARMTDQEIDAVANFIAGLQQ
ncbi:MAG: cytochrome c4 [Porticoccaceae bacterium]|nr:cytochrome c4 [Porticoccaceae bacterium]